MIEPKKLLTASAFILVHLTTWSQINWDKPSFSLEYGRGKINIKTTDVSRFDGANKYFQGRTFGVTRTYYNSSGSFLNQTYKEAYEIPVKPKELSLGVNWTLPMLATEAQFGVGILASRSYFSYRAPLSLRESMQEYDTRTSPITYIYENDHVAGYRQTDRIGVNLSTGVLLRSSRTFMVGIELRQTLFLVVQDRIHLREYKTEPFKTTGGTNHTIAAWDASSTKELKPSEFPPEGHETFDSKMRMNFDSRLLFKPTLALGRAKRFRIYGVFGFGLLTLYGSEYKDSILRYMALGSAFQI